MKSELYKKVELLAVLSPKMSGVFSNTDLRTIFNCENSATFYNTLSTLQKLEVLTRFTNGIYITKNYSPTMLSARIDPKAYISMGTVLANNGLIGTVPHKLVSAVRVGRNRSYSGTELEVLHYGISEQYYFGFSVVDGIKVADNEKAYIDLLYYRMKGASYAFDELGDVDVTRLDVAKYRRYLKKYRNKRFVSFCLEQIGG